MDIIKHRLRFRGFNVPENFLEQKLETGTLGHFELDTVLTGPFYPVLSRVEVVIIEA